MKLGAMSLFGLKPDLQFKGTRTLRTGQRPPLGRSDGLFISGRRAAASGAEDGAGLGEER